MEQQEQNTPLRVLFSATRLLHHMGNIFQDRAPSIPASGGMQMDRKGLKQLKGKKIALGHKPDDHKETQSQRGMTMSGQ